MRSILVVNSVNTTIDLTTLETVKAEYGIPDDDTSQDANLSRWITEASNAVATYLGRVLGQETVTETFLPNRTSNQPWTWPSETADALYLTRKPVSSITSITVDGTAYTTGQYTVDYTNGVIYGMTSGTPIAWAFAMSIVVVYVAGYELLETLPYDIERAVINMVGMARSSAARSGDEELIEEDIVGVARRRWFRESSSEASASRTVLSPEITVLLEPYRTKWGHMR